MALKTCRVSCIDLRGIGHAAEVSASSLYEAVAQALRIFRDIEWIEGIGSGQTPISVKVNHPETEHTVRVRDFKRWVARYQQFGLGALGRKRRADRGARRASQPSSER